MNRVQIAFCEKVNEEYFSVRQNLCREIFEVFPVVPTVITQKEEVDVLNVSKQLVTINVIRTALINACQRNMLTTNQLNHLLTVENLIDRVSQKWDTQYDNVDKEVTDAAKEVEADEEARRKKRAQEHGERIPLI